MIAPPDTTIHYVETLRRIAQAADAKTIIEIGVGPDAISAATFLNVLGEGGRLVSIEIDETRPDTWQRKLAFSSDATWQIIHGDSLTVPLPHLSADLLYIDGDHAGDYPLREFERYEPYVRDGGYIVVDDYPLFQGVYDAVNKLKDHGWCGLFIPYDPDNSNGHVVYRKPGRIPMPKIEGSV